MKNKVYLKRRRWLRSIKSCANQSSVHVNVEGWENKYTDLKTKKKKKERGIYGTLSLRDCTDYTEFSFTATKKKKAKRQLKVIESLLKDVQEFRDSYAKAIEETWDAKDK